MAKFTFMKTEGPELKGWCQEKNHLNWIEVGSWNFSVSNDSDPTKGAGGTKGVAHLSEFSFIKEGAKTVPSTTNVLTQGGHIDKVTFHAERTGQKSEDKHRYMEMVFYNCTLSGDSPDNSEPNAPHSLSFSFTKFEMRYMELKKEGMAGAPSSMMFDAAEKKWSRS